VNQRPAPVVVRRVFTYDGWWMFKMDSDGPNHSGKANGYCLDQLMIFSKSCPSCLNYIKKEKKDSYNC